MVCAKLVLSTFMGHLLFYGFLRLSVTSTIIQGFLFVHSLSLLSTRLASGFLLQETGCCKLHFSATCNSPFLCKVIQDFTFSQNKFSLFFLNPLKRHKALRAFREHFLICIIKKLGRSRNKSENN